MHIRTNIDIHKCLIKPSPWVWFQAAAWQALKEVGWNVLSQNTSKQKGWMYLQVTTRFHHSSPAHWEAIPRVHGIITVADGGLDGAAILERATRNGRGPALLTWVDQGPSYKDHQRSVSWQFQACLCIHSFFFLGTNAGEERWGIFQLFKWGNSIGQSPGEPCSGGPALLSRMDPSRSWCKASCLGA